MGKYISKRELLNMLSDVPESGMLAIADAGNDGNCPIVGVRPTETKGFHEIVIDSKERW